MDDSSKKDKNYASEWESLFIHLIDNSFDDTIVDLAEKWDKTPGLSEKQQVALYKIEFFRKYIEKIAYIKQHKRISDTSLPASPLTGFLGEAFKFIQADSATVEKVWLNTLGLGAFKIRVADGTMSFNTPPVLCAVGVPSELSASVPSIDIKFPPDHDGSTKQPYIKVNLESGPFDIIWGESRLIKEGQDRGKIQVEFSVKGGATLCRGSFTYKWNTKFPSGTGDSEKTLVDLGVLPKLGSDLTGKIYFKIENRGLNFDRVSFSSLDIDFTMPKLPSTLAPIQKYFNQLETAIENEVRQLINKLDLGGLLSPYASNASKSLLAMLQKEAPQHGVVGIEAVQELRMSEEGNLGAEVKVTTYKGPSLTGMDEFRKVRDQQGLSPSESTD